MSDVSADATLNLTMQAHDESSGVVEGVKGALEGMQAAVGAIGIATAAAFAQSAESFEQYGMQVQKIGFMTGQSTEQSSRLISAFEGQGLSAQQATGMIQRMEMRLGTMSAAQEKAAAAHKTSNTAMDQLGISMRDATGHMIPMNDLMPQIIDKLKGIEDPTERARIATQLFGRNWAQIGPAIEAGGDSFRKAMGDADRFGLVLGKDQVEAAHNAHVAHMQLMEALQGLQVMFGQVALPVLVAFNKGLTDLMAAFIGLGPHVTGMVVHVAGLTAVFGTLFGGAEAITSAIHHFGSAIPFIGDHFERLSLKMAAFLGPVGEVIGVFLLLKSAFDNIGIVHMALLPLVDLLHRAFQTTRDTLELFMGTLQHTHDGWKALEGAVRLAMHEVGVGEGQIRNVEQALSQLHQTLVQVLGPVLAWNDALLKGKDAGTATNTLLSQLVTAFPQLAGAVATLRGVFDESVAVVRQFMTTFQQTHSVTAALMTAFAQMGAPMQATQRIFALIGQVAAALGAGLHQIALSVMPALSKAMHDLQPTWDQLQPAIQQVRVALTALQPVFMAIGAVLGLLGMLILALLGGAWQALVNALSVLLPAAIHIVVVAINLLVNVIGLIATIVSGVVTIVYDLFTGNWAGAWNAAVNMVRNSATYIGRIVGDLVDLITTLLHTGINLLIGIIGGFVQGVIGAFMNLWDALVGHSIIPDMINSIFDWFSRLPGMIGNALAALPGVVLDATQAALNAVWNLVQGAAGAGAALGGALASGITGALSGLGWALQRAVENAISYLPGPAQDALHMIGLQGGGIVTRPTLALLGEKPGGQREAVLPLDHLPSLMAEAMRQVGGGGGGPQVIVLQLDGKEMARVVMAHGANRWKLMGGTNGSGS